MSTDSDHNDHQPFLQQRDTHTINASYRGQSADCTAACRLAPAPSARALVQHLPCWLGIQHCRCKGVQHVHAWLLR